MLNSEDFKIYSKKFGVFNLIKIIFIIVNILIKTLYLLKAIKIIKMRKIMIFIS